MPVYAPTPGFAVQRPHPKTLMLIVGAHAVALAAVITAKMELPQKLIPTITKVDLIRSAEASASRAAAAGEEGRSGEQAALAAEPAPS